VTLVAFLLCSMSFGGSLIRPEATGYGLIYFVEVRSPHLRLGNTIVKSSGREDFCFLLA
jgi:hypothetical protein